MGGGRLCLGIDPGLARVGYGVVERQGSRLRALTYGCVETSPKLPFTQRLLHIYEALGEQLEHCAPDFMSVERLFFGRNITTAGGRPRSERRGDPRMAGLHGARPRRARRDGEARGEAGDSFAEPPSGSSRLAFRPAWRCHIWQTNATTT